MKINIHIVLSEIGGSGKTSFSRYLLKFFGKSSLGVDLGFPHKSLSQGDDDRVLNISIPSIGKDLHSNFGEFFEKVFCLLSKEIERRNVGEVVIDVGVAFFFPVLLYIEKLREKESSFLRGNDVFFHFMISSQELETSIVWQTNMLKRYIEKDKHAQIGKGSIFFWVNSFLYGRSKERVSKWEEFIDKLGVDRFSGLYLLPEADRSTMDCLFEVGAHEDMDAFKRERISAWENEMIKRIEDALRK